MSNPNETSLSSADERFCYHCGTENPQGVRWQSVLKGLIVLIAVYVDLFRKRRLFSK
jgi:hypothetical protein